MKILENLPTWQAIQNNSGKSAKGSADFSQALQEAQAKSESTTTGAASTSAVMAASSAAGIMAVNMAGPQVQLDSAISALDSYSKALADPTKTLKDIGSLVRDLEKESARMTELGQSLPDGHQLKDLVDRTGVLAAVEAEKFNRGDFV